MPHGISPPHSAPRSSNTYPLLWYPSTSLPISTATGNSCNIGTHCNILYVRYHNVFSSIRTPTFFSCRTDYPATLMMQHFYYRNELLARNSTDRFITPTGADQAHTGVPHKLSKEISSWPTTLLALFLSLLGHARLNTTVSLPSPLSSMTAFLLQTQLPYASHASVTGPAHDSHLPYKANSYFTSC